MNPLNFYTNPGTPLVADASAVINLNASLCAAEILKSLPHPVVVTDHAWRELEDGTSKEYNDAKCLEQLASAGLIKRVSLGTEGYRIYEHLVTGNTIQSLDDGEAATIGHAYETQGIALIDETKATRLCGEFYPSVELVSTAELLLHSSLRGFIGSEQQAVAILNALRGANMNVPKPLLKQVLESIGVDAARTCPSLPRCIR